VGNTEPVVATRIQTYPADVGTAEEKKNHAGNVQLDISNFKKIIKEGGFRRSNSTEFEKAK